MKGLVVVDHVGSALDGTAGCKTRLARQLAGKQQEYVGQVDVHRNKSQGHMRCCNILCCVQKTDLTVYP